MFFQEEEFPLHKKIME